MRGRWINLLVILVIYNFSFTSSNGEFKRLGGAMTPLSPNVALALIVLLSSDQDINKFLVYAGDWTLDLLFHYFYLSHSFFAYFGFFFWFIYIYVYIYFLHMSYISNLSHTRLCFPRFSSAQLNFLSCKIIILILNPQIQNN